MNKNLILNISIFCALILVLATGFSKREEIKKYKEGEFIVKINSKKFGRIESSEKFIRNILEAHLGFAIKSITPFVTDAQFAVVRIDERQNIMDAISILNSSDDFSYAQPNFLYTLQDESTGGAPNDADFAQAWGLKNIGQAINNLKGKEGADIDVMPLWEKGIVGKSEIIVGVVDTGIDGTHPDLVDNLFVNVGESGELATNGIDDDKNGFVDDVNGWNFFAKTNNPFDGHSHGTHTSGTIGAVGNNGTGVPGVNWKVRLLPIKIFSDSGGYAGDDQVIEGINYAVKMGAKVLSNSWGGGGYSKAMFEAIQNAQKAGVLFVAAAGNYTDDNDQYSFYPAGYDLDNVIAVAATTNTDDIASYSNYGAKSVHVAAPGSSVYSTVPAGKYAFKSGTSMATPHVSGIAALLLSEFPNTTPAKIRETLIKSSVEVPSLKDKCVANGRVSAANAYAALASEQKN